MFKALLEMGKDSDHSVEGEAQGPETVFINQGPKIEAMQYEVKQVIKACEWALEELNRERKQLWARIKGWWQLQLQHMPGVTNLLAAIKGDIQPKDEELYLPSFFRDGQYVNTSLAHAEGQLRKGQAFTLTHQVMLVRTKCKESCGVTRNTRVMK
ncbi:hypothetical protein V5O48_014115 [Marasmius crinis-equi]|uniref:Uncharacterized protein n=1 Tax=Marasmius crinis-equi TaxID=585013 RepID=A0ABR3EY77_9AGAR